MVVSTGGFGVPVFCTSPMRRTILFFLTRFIISDLGMDDGGISVFSDRMCKQKDNREATFCLLYFTCLAILSPLDTAQLSFHRIRISLLIPGGMGVRWRFPSLILDQNPSPLTPLPKRQLKHVTDPANLHLIYTNLFGQFSICLA